MKTYFNLVFLLALFLSSCCEDELVKNPAASSDALKFIASFEENESRTYVEEGNLLRWSQGDKISLFVGNTLNQKFQFDGETGDNGGTFSKVNSPFGTGNDLSVNYAVYPYDSKVKITEKGIITAILPSEQNYAENSFGLGANTMVAVTQGTDDTFLKFKNVGGYLKLQLYGNDIIIKNITLKGNSNEKLAGKATITPVYGGEPTIEMSAEATEMITLDCGEGVNIGATAETATAFWMVVPPTIFEGGFTTTITDMEGNEYTKSTSNKVVVERNVINPMSAFEVKNQNTDIPYVTFTAEGAQTFTISSAVETLEYSVNDGEWTTLGTSIIDFGGELGSLKLRGKNNSGTAGLWGNKIIFGNTIPVACFGDIRTLLDYENYLTVNTTKARFTSLFKDCSCLTSAPTLPITELSRYCYEQMFMGCTSLTIAPEIPATTLVESCYRQMFSGCTNLTIAPSLPATTLADNCYEQMFVGCTSLTVVPELPATTLANDCYYAMFSDCTSLTSAPELPARILAGYCYCAMFNNCINLVQVPELPATDLAICCYGFMFAGCSNITQAPQLPATVLPQYCYPGMFNNCISLTQAPVLPATTLTYKCYEQMFEGCSTLNSIAMLATNIDAADCLNNWVNGVSSTGTLIKAANMEGLPEGNSGIPEGWTVVNYGESNNSLTVTLTEAGTLGEYLTDANRNIVEELKIIGDINGTDIQLIREITKVSLTTGAPTEDTGALIKLDLSEANIVAGGNPYKAIRPDEEISTQNNVVTPGMFGYTNLKTIVLPDNIKEIGESAFEALLNMETFTIPTSVTKIADKAFNTCQNLSSVSISTNVTEIGSHAFYDCKSLTEVTIPGNVSTIGSYAFGHCVSLLKVYCESLVPPALTANSFQLCNALQAIYVPSSAIDKYKENAVWKQYNIIAE